MQGQHTVHVGRQLHVMGRDEHRHPFLLRNVEKVLENHPRSVGIEVPGRLVGNQDLGLVGQRPGDGDALLFAARQLAGPVMVALR